MADTSNEILKGCIAALKADGTLSGLVGQRIYVDVPQKAQFPYIKLGLETQPFATQSFSGCEHLIKVQIFSRDSSSYEASRIRAACWNVMDRNEGAITLDSGTLVMMQYSGLGTLFQEDDGRTWQALAEFRALVQ